ncbi:hypothetical protein LCM4579_02845 [Ensifer sp. LCM 4579]|nr:hypothetical protein LCM4579_02845 [Ensifer sp. LCM 4579]
MNDKNALASVAKGGRPRGPTATPSHKRNIGMVFQRYTLCPHLSVGENITFPLKVRRWPKAEIDAKVHAILTLVRPGRLRGS